MTIRRKLAIAATIFILVGTVAVGLFRFWPQQVRAFNPQPDPPGYGLVGITNGQTIRVSVVNTTPPDPNAPPDPCRAVITFVDANGNSFIRADGTPARKTVLIDQGQSAFLNLNADNFVRNGRLTLRPDIRIQQADPVLVGDSFTPPDPCFASAEVISNSSGQTQFMMPFIPAVQRATQPAAN